MAGDNIGSDASTDRRTFVKRSAAASVGLGVALDREDSLSEVPEQEDGPVPDYYNFVVPNRGIIEADFINKFLFTTGFRRRIDDNPFDECFANAEEGVEQQFEDGALVYDGLLVEPGQGFQLFGDDDEAAGRLRRVLEDQGIDLPEMLDESIGAMVGTYVFTPPAEGRVPTTEGYRSVSGELCGDDYIRLRVHELPSEVTRTTTGQD